MAPERGTDWSLLEREFAAYVRGDSRAARAFFDAMPRVLEPFFFVRTRSEKDTEDLVQATLLKLHFSRGKYDPTRALKTFVFTVARNTLIDHWRGGDEAKGVQREALDDEEASRVPSPELDPAMRAELARDLGRAMETLKPNDRLIVYLYGAEGFSMAEIAETLGLTEAAVKLRAHRSYVQLRKRL